MIEFGVLGPLTVHGDGQPVALPALMLRRLLAVLISQLGRPVSADRLADAMWDGSPPATARKTLQVYVHRLRQALGDPERIQHGAGGYQVAIGSDELDALRFADLATRARAARRDGRLDDADELFGQALRLWRGEPYADLSDSELLAVEVRRLTEEHLQMREDSIGVGLDLGRHAELIAELTSLTRAHPYREGLLACLMLALYRCGRQTEALGAFRRTYERLADELGIDPGAALQQLHAAILRGDQRLARIATTELAQLTDDGRQAATTSLTATKPAQLPADTAAFTGRATQLRRLDTLLPGAQSQGPTAVVISAIAGTAGIGKTSLAVHWAHRVADRFPDGQLYVNLRGFDPAGSAMSSAEAVRGFLQAFAVPPERIPEGMEAQAGLYRSTLAGKRVLVVLDNARDAEQVRPLLPGSPGCLVVVTSRNQLPALIATHGARPLILDLLTAAEARQLLTRRLGVDRVAAEPQAVDEIISRCARLPLALAVVAARAATRPELPLVGLAAELRGVHDGLDAFAGDDAATDVRAVFSWSYQTLSAAAARLFRLLGLHPGPDIATPAVASLAGIPLGKVRPLLEELARAHLITEPTLGRYTFHDLLRAYATELTHTLDTDEERHGVAHRMLDHYLHTAYAGSLLLYPHRYPIALTPTESGVTPAHLTDHVQAMDWFTAEHSVLLAVTHQAADLGFDTHTWQLAWASYIYLDRRGHWADQVAIHRTALDAARRQADLTGQARTHHGLGNAYTWLSRYQEAQLHYEQALGLFAELGDDIGQAHSHLNFAMVFEQQEQHAEALHQAQRSLDLFLAAGHRSGQAKALNTVGWYQAMLGRYQQALTNCEQAITLLVELGDRYGEAATWDSLGYVQHNLGEYGQAATSYQQSVDLWRILGDRHSEAAVLTRLGDTHQTAACPDSAREAWQQAFVLLSDLGHDNAAQVREKLGQLDEPTAARR